MEKTSKLDILNFMKKRQLSEPIAFSTLMNKDENNDTSECVELEASEKQKTNLLRPTSVSSERKRKTSAISNPRSKKFHRYFPQLSKNEKILNYFSCTLIRDHMLQGHLYVTNEHLAFHSNFFGYVTNLIIPTSSVRHLTKEKTAKILPTIGVTTAEHHHVFANFFSRSSAFLLISSVCLQLVDNEDSVEVGKEIHADKSSLSDDNDYLFEHSTNSNSNSSDNDSVTKLNLQPNISQFRLPIMANANKTPTPKKPTRYILQDHLLTVIILATLLLTCMSMCMLYQVVAIETKASSLFHQKSNLKLNYNTLDVSEKSHISIPNHLEHFEKVQQSLEILSRLILNRSHVTNGVREL